MKKQNNNLLSALEHVTSFLLKSHVWKVVLNDRQMADICKQTKITITKKTHSNNTRYLTKTAADLDLHRLTKSNLKPPEQNHCGNCAVLNQQ